MSPAATTAPAPPPADAETGKENKTGRALEYISASRLSCWQQCRRKHHFRYVEGIPSVPTPAMHLGKAVHATLQQWNLWRWDGKWGQGEGKHTRAHLRTAFLLLWDELQQGEAVPWKSEKEQDTLRDKAWQLVTAYLDAAVIDEAEDIAGVEVRLEAEIDGLPTLVGIVDLVRGDGRIVDFKTAARTPVDGCAEIQHGTQLGVYALLYRHCTGTTEKGIELHHLIKTREPKVHVTGFGPMDGRETNNVIALMRRYVESVKAGDTTPSPSFMCAGCEYLEQCGNWREKGSLHTVGGNTHGQAPVARLAASGKGDAS